MPLLTKELLTTLPELGYEDVPVPEFGEDVSVRVRDWDGTAGGLFEDANTKRRQAKGDPTSDETYDNAEFRALLVAVSVVDDSGNRVFDLNGDIESIARWHYPALKRVSDVVVRRNKIGASAVEDAKKN